MFGLILYTWSTEKLFLVTKSKKKITKASRCRGHCLGRCQVRPVDYEQAASFFRLITASNCPCVQLWNFVFGHLKFPGLSPRMLCCFLLTVQDIAMLCEFADDMLSPNK